MDFVSAYYTTNYTVVLISLPDSPVACVTCSLNILIVHESVLRIDIRRVPGMASDASSGVGVGRLPASQELVPVIVPALALPRTGNSAGNG